MKSLNDKRYRILISRLKQARLEKGMNQIAVAKHLKRPQSFISKVENIERRLDAIELYDLMSLYGLSWDKLTDKL